MLRVSFEGNVNAVEAEGSRSRVRIGEITQPLVIDGDMYSRRSAGMPQADLEFGGLHQGEARLFVPWFGRRVRVTIEVLDPVAHAVANAAQGFDGPARRKR